MATPVFITGIGTDVGKTVVSAILTEALQADYWKPVQAGFDAGTDTQWVQQRLSNTVSKTHPELYKLALPASPHIAARQEGVHIDPAAIVAAFGALQTDNPYVVVEGAGGLLVPVNERQFVADIVQALGAKVVLVSRNYLGSINHSLLTAEACRQRGLDVTGWVFNDQYMDYEAEIAQWSGYPVLGNVPLSPQPDKAFVRAQALLLRDRLTALL